PTECGADAFHESRPRRSPIAFPKLTTQTVISRKEDRSAHICERTNIRVTEGRYVLDQNGARGCSVARPERSSVDAIVCFEINTRTDVERSLVGRCKGEGGWCAAIDIADEHGSQCRAIASPQFQSVHSIIGEKENHTASDVGDQLGI